MTFNTQQTSLMQRRVHLYLTQHMLQGDEIIFFHGCGIQLLVNSFAAY